MIEIGPLAAVADSAIVGLLYVGLRSGDFGSGWPTAAQLFAKR